MPWLNAVNRLAAGPLLVLSGDVTPTVFIGSAPFGWDAVAEELASELPGFTMPNGGGGVSWKNGAGPMNGVILDAENARRVLAARDLVASIIPQSERGRVIPYSEGAMARMLLLWAAAPQARDKTLEHLIRPDGDLKEYMYHDCKPGRYEAATLWDCSAYFFNLMSRAKGLRVSLGRPPAPDLGPVGAPSGPDRPAGGRAAGGRAEAAMGRLRWQRMAPDEAYRWADVLAVCREEKILRNSLWGASLGSVEGKTAYTSSPPKDAQGRRVTCWPPGKVRKIAPVFGPGPFRPFALLIARSAAELTSIASEQVGSVYSTVDSVTSVDGREPKIWGSIGLPYGPKHRGDAVFVTRGCWRIGPHPTIPFCPMVKIASHLEGRRLTSWRPDKAAALLPGYSPKRPQTPVPHQTMNNYYYTQWL